MENFDINQIANVLDEEVIDQVVQQVTPVITPETPTATAISTPEVSTEALTLDAPAAQPEVTPEDAPMDIAEVQPEVAPEAPVEEKPKGKPGPAAILSLIRGAETSRGYNDYSRFATIAPPKAVAEMTIGEIKRWQRQAARAGSKSVAIGGYQMITKTFNATVDTMGLSDDDVFTPELQDRMGTHLLVGRGYNRWLSGAMSDEQFADNLSMEWAGLPRVTGPKRGRSHYAGDGLNASSTKVDTVFAALEASRDGAAFEYRPSKGGVPSAPTGPSQRDILLSNIDPNKNYTGADMEQVGSVGMQTYRSTLDEKVADRAVTGGEQPSFWDATKMAVDQEWVSSAILRQMGKEEFKPDVNFTFSKELFDEVSEGLPAEYAEGLSGATSEAHARAIADTLRKELATNQKLGSLGWGGTGLRLGAAILDPAAIAISAASEGTAAPFIYGAKISRAGRALRAGAVAGTVNAGIDGYITSQSPVGQWEDVAFSAAAGFVLGGAIGAFRRMPEDEALDPLMRDIANGNIVKGPADGSVGAARVPQDKFVEGPDQVIADAADAPKTVRLPLMPRIDRVGILKQSPNGVTRKLSALLGEDAVGNADGSVNVRAASENISRESRVRLARFYRTYNESYKAWKAETGAGNANLGMNARSAFNEAVGKAVRREINEETSAHVNAVASQMKTEFKSLLEFGRDKNIRGFDEIKDNYNYMARRHRIDRLDDLVSTHGEGNINQLVARSLMSSNKKWMARNAGRGAEELDYEDALKIAASYVKSIRSRRYGSFDANRALAGQDMDTLKMMLDDAGMSPEDIVKITSKVGRGSDDVDRGRMDNAKYRLDLDETYSMDMIVDGQKRSVGIEDFLENDAEQLFQHYSRSVLGAGYAEEALSGFRVADEAGEMPRYAPSYATVRGYIQKEAQQKGVPNKDMNSELRMMDNLYNTVVGKPIEGPSKFRDAQRLLRDYNFTRIGGQLGFAQLPEIGNIIGNAGMRVMLQSMPSLRKVFWKAKNGKFDDDFLNEAEAIWGFGTDLTRATPAVKMDDVASANIEDASKMARVDYGLQQAKIATSVGSGMAHVNMVMQRLNSRVLVQRFMDDATGRRSINSKRLRVMGIDDGMHSRIQAQMVKHVDQSTGMLGKKIKRINIENWDDIDAKNAFVNGVDRWAKKSVQENDIGNMPDFMSYELGKTIGQFRSFMMAAYTKQLVSGLHHRDWETFSAFTTSIFFGSIFYSAQQNINAQGRADREEYLEKRLNPASLAAASFQRAGFASVVPMAVDAAVGFAGLEPIFDYRSSGLANAGGPVTTAMSNPSLDLLDKAFRAPSGVGAALSSDDYDYSQQDYRALTGLLPFQNMLGIRNMLSIVGSELPQYSQ